VLVDISCLKFLLPLHTHTHTYITNSLVQTHSWKVKLLSWSVSATWTFITTFTSVRIFSLLKMKWILSESSCSIYVRSTVIHFCLCVGHPNGLLSPGVWPKLYAFLTSPICRTWPAYLFLLGVTTQILYISHDDDDSSMNDDAFASPPLPIYN
jgi:hypothetical protein